MLELALESESAGQMRDCLAFQGGARSFQSLWTLATAAFTLVTSRLETGEPVGQSSKPAEIPRSCHKKNFLIGRQQDHTAIAIRQQPKCIQQSHCAPNQYSSRKKWTRMLTNSTLEAIEPNYNKQPEIMCPLTSRSTEIEPNCAKTQRPSMGNLVKCVVFTTLLALDVCHKTGQAMKSLHSRGKKPNSTSIAI